MPPLTPMKTPSREPSDSAVLPPAPRKKTRLARRRGRAKNITESDDEIEHKVATDSDSGDEDQSTSSGSDTDTEPASEDLMSESQTRVLTPGTSQSPVDRSLLRDELSANVVAQMNDGNNSFFKATGTWSEMVAEETANGPADLPVVDFEDFNGRVGHEQPSSTSRTRKSQNKSVSNRTASASPLKPSTPPSISDPSSTSNTATQGDIAGGDKSTSSTSKRATNRSYERLPGQTARQAYQQRLESDPSYVPTLGEFWGHDDRLMDKNLRSLSGWWRIRWERGRGRGSISRGASNVGRGRGGNGGGQSVPPANGDLGQSGVNSGKLDAPDVPPIERIWGHDGFEEMRRREERNHSPPQGQASHPRGAGNGSPSTRTRGRPSTENASPSTALAKTHYPTDGAAPSGIAPPRRPWFTMRPERAWTKQHDAFLYIDPTLRPRSGQGSGMRLKLPGEAHAQIVRVPPGTFSTVRGSAPKAVASATGSEDGEKTFVVRLPPCALKAVEKDTRTVPSTIEETVTTVEQPPMEDAPTCRPPIQVPPVVPLSSTAKRALSLARKPEPGPAPAEVANGEKASQLTQPSPPKAPTDAARTTESEPSSKAPVPGPPALAPIQTTFSPVPQQQPQPPYGSAYAYAPSFAHGIAMGQNGVPYDVATGRAVYLQPPPPTLYNAQPMLHAPIPMPYANGHVRHHMTPDFLPQAQLSSPTPPMPTFIDPSTGSAIFSLPRQNSRIEIRPPPTDANGDSVVTDKSSGRRASDLRNGATPAYVSPRLAESSGHADYFAALNGARQGMSSYLSADMRSSAEGGQAPQHQQTLDPAMAAYPVYHHQQYFYPEAYGFPQYVDMSQIQGYDVYSSDPRGSQPTAYY